MLLERTPYRTLEHHEIDLEQSDRIVELYDMLYLEKYSHLNPMFTRRWIRHVHANNLLDFIAFERDGRIDAVAGTFTRARVATPPLFGYDTRLPQDEGLYRLIFAATSRACRKRGDLLNFSAGVSEFKRNRGCVPSLEYHAVFDGHLPRYRRVPWRALQELCDRWVVPLMEERNL